MPEGVDSGGRIILLSERGGVPTETCRSELHPLRGVDLCSNLESFEAYNGGFKTFFELSKDERTGIAISLMS